MSEINIFEAATRCKLRFASNKGLLTVEQLWELPLTNGIESLDNIAKNLYRELKDNEIESFVVKKSTNVAITQLQLRFDIVKYIIDCRIKKISNDEKFKIQTEKKHKIMEIINQKQDKELLETSIEDLQKMIDDI